MLTDRYASLSRFLNDIHVPPLNSLAPATEFVLNADLRKLFANGHLDVERAHGLLNEAKRINATLETDAIAFAAKNYLDRLSDELFKKPEDFDVLQRLTESAALVQILPFGVNLWKPQNIYDQLTSKVLPEMKGRGDEKSRAWTEKFLTLGERIGFHVERN